MQLLTKPASPGIVLVHPGPLTDSGAAGHESVTHEAVARRLAALIDFEFQGRFERGQRYERDVYLVPSMTLTSGEARDEFGIRSEHDLFGGVVPYPFVATKTITHRLPHAQSVAPEGWSSEFADRVAHVTLPGYSAFSIDDALVGGMRLLERGAVRLKLADGIGGSGQWVLGSHAELEARLRALGGEVVSHGVVLEVNLHDVTTLSVGCVCVGPLVAAYFGTQREVVNNHGHVVYGGSELTVARGGWDALLKLDLTRTVRAGCEQALLYDSAARACFSGLFMSRRNYDVAQGFDDADEWRSGVLEQSWRVGGASGAEVAALEAFKANPGLSLVRASTTEIYGPDVPVPDDAVVYFQGIDERVGPLLKYAQVS